MKTYITLQEALNKFPNGTEYTPEQQKEALQDSFSLVNSFLPSNISVPVVTSDGKVPGILKIFQSRFFKWILESSNMGWTEELQNLYNSTSDALSKLTKNELLISEATTTKAEIGWNIISSTLTGGFVYVGGIPPLMDHSLEFVVSSTGTQFANNATFNVYRSDSNDVYRTFDGSFSWQYLNELEIRFDGKFTNGESFIVKGVADTKKTVSSKPSFEQLEIWY